MFYHVDQLQYNAKPTKPDAVYAKKLQEILGGQLGEISVALQYLFQGWNVRGDEKYRDLLMATGTEELAHVEMLATMIAVYLRMHLLVIKKRLQKILLLGLYLVG